MLNDAYPLFLANEPLAHNADLIVTNKYTLEPAARVARADAEMIDHAVAAATKAFELTRKMPSHQRQAILNHAAGRIEQRHDELSQALAIEAGKPLRDARVEVTRLSETFRIAEEAVRITGEYLPLDVNPRAGDYEAVTRRFPLGPCGFITPFNFPMNLVAHKAAPAIAAGCSWVLKPASATPIGALMLGEILAETDLPKGAFSILPCTGDEAGQIVTDERLKLLSFTGSAEVGWNLKTLAGKKRVCLELGGNAGCIVDRDADLAFAADRITLGAFYQSGQSCISVQRVYAHREIYEDLKALLVERAAMLKTGDPLSEETFLGPLITVNDAERIEAWVAEAVAAGARILSGGKRDGAFYEATWLENADREQKVNRCEVFAPVATLAPFDSFRDAVAAVNDSDFGLQAGVFTKHIDHAMYAFNELEVGGVVVNDMPSFRVDSMPYGGVKNSGFGREGVRWSIEEMTELKLLVMNKLGKL